MQGGDPIDTFKIIFQLNVNGLQSKEIGGGCCGSVRERR